MSDAYKRAGQRLRQIFIEYSTDASSRWNQLESQDFYEAAIRDACRHAGLMPASEAYEQAEFRVQTSMTTLRQKVDSQADYIKELRKLTHRPQSSDCSPSAQS